MIKDLLEVGAKIGRKAPPLETMDPAAKVKFSQVGAEGVVEPPQHLQE